MNFPPRCVAAAHTHHLCCQVSLLRSCPSPRQGEQDPAGMAPKVQDGSLARSKCNATFYTVSPISSATQPGTEKQTLEDVSWNSPKSLCLKKMLNKEIHSDKAWPDRTAAARNGSFLREALLSPGNITAALVPWWSS
ncbi:hypothetical protein Anapl_02397 [Anas platyrhynchos]|uniref:Uncharacterized protein n=1 Tax=Anas platyrhynchos TaxID=8839 RepID=R0JYK9_ANAPL|nr:hypothetical protein Anapl_02397 [Anas platyrhynchos]